MTTPDPRTSPAPGTDALGGTPGDRPSPPPMEATGPDGPAPAVRTSGHKRRTAGRTIAIALLLFVTVVLVLFVVFNTQRVQISLVFTDVRAPLVVALLVAAALGGAIVGLLDAVMVARQRRRKR